jgi:LuxR family transcriptional regulator, maltose regulon positive regulatory protein
VKCLLAQLGFASRIRSFATIWTGEFDEGERWLQRTRWALQTDTGPDIRQLLHLATGGSMSAAATTTRISAAERLRSQMEGSHALASQVTGWSTQGARGQIRRSA